MNRQLTGNSVGHRRGRGLIAGSCPGMLRSGAFDRKRCPMMRVIRLLAVTLMVAGGLLALTPATANASNPACTNSRGVVCFAYASPAGTTPDWSTNYCFNQEGHFRLGTSVIKVDWTSNGSFDECFGIAPDRRIYHAWPNSVGWDPMPNNGLADIVDIAFPVSGNHTISVFVYSNNKDYCSTLAQGAWTPWYICTVPTS
jgi:hypothetical protein